MSGGSIGGTLGTALGVALAPETGGLSLAIPAMAGAAGGALGGGLTGSKNILRDALFGGIGGAAGGGLNNLTGNASGLGGLFDAGTQAAPQVVSQGFGDGAAQLAQGFGSAAGQGFGDAFTPAASSSGLFGSASKLLPYAALSGGATLLDSMNKPKTLGPQMQSHPSNPGQVAPLARTQQSVDPNSYYAASTPEARNYFAPYPMQPQFMSKGGKVRGFKNGGSSSASSSNIPGKRNSAVRYYSDGGPAGLGMIKGAGDGRSDSIPANLSDGEFVMSAPVVSALGNGSNDAGAKKLDRVQKNVLKKHYKGGKPHKAMGLGNYAH